MVNFCNRVNDGHACQMRFNHTGLCEGVEVNDNHSRCARPNYKDNKDYNKRPTSTSPIQNTEQLACNEVTAKQHDASHVCCQFPIRASPINHLANQSQRIPNGSSGSDSDSDIVRVNTFSKGHKCSKCGGTGHNSRTCTFNSSNSDKSSDDVDSDSNSSIELSDSSVLSLHKESNNFQMGIDTIRKFMGYQIGVKFTTCTSICGGKYVNDDQQFYKFDAKIKRVSTVRNYIVECECNDGETFEFTSAEMLATKTSIQWNKVPEQFYQDWEKELLSDIKHKNSMDRATEFAKKYSLANGNAPSSDDILITLDGNGENRKGMEKAFSEAGFEKKTWPRILTFEMNADVALASRMMFGENVIYTGADPNFHSKSLIGGKHGVLLEHIITKKNLSLTDEMHLRVKAVYFDYCGGPPGNQHPKKCKSNFEKNIFPNLPNLNTFAMTISHRQHADVGREFTKYVHVPHGFKEVADFRSNKKVICKIYSKKQPPKVNPTNWTRCTGAEAILNQTCIQNNIREQVVARKRTLESGAFETSEFQKLFHEEMSRGDFDDIDFNDIKTKVKTKKKKKLLDLEKIENSLKVLVEEGFIN